MEPESIAKWVVEQGIENWVLLHGSTIVIANLAFRPW